MRSPKHRESVSEEQAEPAERAAAPANVPLWAPRPWILAAGVVADWYGEMFRLAFGLPRVNSRSAVQAPPAPPPTEQAEARPVALLPAMPAAPVALRPKRSRSRSSKPSKIRRRRRAA